MSGIPTRYPVSNAVSVLEWLAMIVLLSSLFLSGWVLQVLEHDQIPSFFFNGTDGEDRTCDLTVHNLTSCLRRLKMLRNKCHSSYCLLNSFFHPSIGIVFVLLGRRISDEKPGVQGEATSAVSVFHRAERNKAAIFYEYLYATNTSE